MSYIRLYVGLFLCFLPHMGAPAPSAPCSSAPPPPPLDIKPIFYVHVPKCGGSIATLLAHYGCTEIPYDLVVREPSKFALRYPPHWHCKGGFARFETGHDPVSEIEFAAHKGHTVVILREPRQRLVSGFLHDFHDCPRLQERFSCRPRESSPSCYPVFNRLFNADPSTLRALFFDYARCVEGCAVSMLTGTACGNRAPDSPPLDAAAKIAVQSLDSFGFCGDSGAVEYHNRPLEEHVWWYVQRRCFCQHPATIESV
jgi:hypothetical protein